MQVSLVYLNSQDDPHIIFGALYFHNIVIASRRNKILHTLKCALSEQIEIKYMAQLIILYWNIIRPGRHK